MSPTPRSAPRALCLTIVALLATAASARLTASEFRDLLTFSDDPSSYRYVGDSTLGNSVTARARYTNVSERGFVVYGVAAAQSIPPHDVGLFDLSAMELGLDELEAAYPTYDLFNSFYFGASAPRQTWVETQIEFDQPLPIVVMPGQSFSYLRTLTNAQLGPDFGPTPTVTDEQVRVLGESLTAINLDWAYVPEPASLALLPLIAALALPRRGR